MVGTAYPDNWSNDRSDYNDNWESYVISGLTEIEEMATNDEFVLMQFTGLKDKNGREIYEGDIVQLNMPRIGSVKSLVCWHKSLGFWDCRWMEKINNMATAQTYSLSKAMRKTKLHEGDMKVIGNVYENSDLIKPEEPEVPSAT